MSTRPHISQFYCGNCRTWQTQESSFGRWLRNNKALDASDGHCFVDQDYIVHKFKTHGGRDFQLLMALEIKTMGAEPTAAQRDTLHLFNQVMRNRKQTPTKDMRFQAGTAPLRVFSTLAGRDVQLRIFGVHVLRFSGMGPDDSETIHWDRTPIDVATLTALLRFDLDPDTLKPLDLRIHHPKPPASLFASEIAAE